SNLKLAGVAPLLCAGITTYSPMRHCQGQESWRGRSRRPRSHGRLGADEVVISRNAEEMQKHAGSFDFILDAVSADYDINAYINLLRRDGNITLVGAPEKLLLSRRL